MTENIPPNSSPLYGKYGRQYAKVVEDNIYNASFERPSIFSLLTNLKKKRVLDAGCGSGEHMIELIRRGARVTAFDLSKELIEIAAAKCEKNGFKANIFHHNLALPIPHFDDGSFDIILSALALHYVADLKQVFKEFNRLLMYGGTVVFSTHHPIVDFQDSQTGDYFQREELSQDWNTVGEPVEVKFFRRSLAETINSVLSSGFVLDGFSEGLVTDELRQKDPDAALKLSTKPSFIFFRFRKCNGS